MSVEIRLCTTAHLPALLELYRQLQPEDTTSLEELTRAFGEMTAFPGAAVYLAVVGNRVVGTFTLYLLPNLTRHGRPAAILENIVVDEAYRGKGIGRVMLEFARAWAQERNCYKLSLTSNAKRCEAHEFYLRCGMIQHGVSFRYTL